MQVSLGIEVFTVMDVISLRPSVKSYSQANWRSSDLASERWKSSRSRHFCHPLGTKVSGKEVENAHLPGCMVSRVMYMKH